MTRVRLQLLWRAQSAKSIRFDWSSPNPDRTATTQHISVYIHETPLVVNWVNSWKKSIQPITFRQTRYYFSYCEAVAVRATRRRLWLVWLFRKAKGDLRCILWEIQTYQNHNPDTADTAPERSYKLPRISASAFRCDSRWYARLIFRQRCIWGLNDIAALFLRAVRERGKVGFFRPPRPEIRENRFFSHYWVAFLAGKKQKNVFSALLGTA